MTAPTRREFLAASAAAVGGAMLPGTKKPTGPNWPRISRLVNSLRVSTATMAAGFSRSEALMRKFAESLPQYPSPAGE